MDIERAKFLLQSFRPDGMDASDPAFAEALALAAKDRELGEWLASERAQDAAFAELLAAVEIPEDLREALFEVIDGPIDEPTEFDADFVGALSSLRPPDGLRADILAAMAVERGGLDEDDEAEENIVPMPSLSKKILRSILWTGSVAAVLAVMVGVALFFAGAGGSALAGSTPLEVERSAIEMLESPFFSLDLQNDRQAALYNWLSDKNLPAPDKLPSGLENLKGVGCKFLKIGEEEKKASLICYRKEDSIVHLVMMERSALDSSEISEMKDAVSECRGCKKNDGWAVTNWADSQHLYFLLSKMEPDELRELF